MGGSPPLNPTEVRGRAPVKSNRPWISACGKLFYKSQLALSSLQFLSFTRTCFDTKPFFKSFVLGLLVVIKSLSWAKIWGLGGEEKKVVAGRASIFFDAVLFICKECKWVFFFLRAQLGSWRLQLSCFQHWNLAKSSLHLSANALSCLSTMQLLYDHAALSCAVCWLFFSIIN